VCVERRLVGPEFECDELIGGQGALKNFELLTAGFLLHGAAAVGHRLGKLGTLAGLGIRGNDETDRHDPLLSYYLISPIASYRACPRRLRLTLALVLRACTRAWRPSTWGVHGLLAPLGHAETNREEQAEAAMPGHVGRGDVVAG
jgi:hypothetical protein